MPKSLRPDGFADRKEMVPVADRRSHPPRPQAWAFTFVFVATVTAMVLVVIGVPLIDLFAGDGGLAPGIYRGWLLVILAVAVIVLAVGGYRVRASARGGTDGSSEFDVNIDG